MQGIKDIFAYNPQIDILKAIFYNKRLQTKVIYITSIFDSKHLWVYGIHLVESELHQHVDKKPPITIIDF